MFALRRPAPLPTTAGLFAGVMIVALMIGWPHAVSAQNAPAYASPVPVDHSANPYTAPVVSAAPDDPYKVTAVAVDVTAASAAAARDKAIADGQRAALIQLLERNGLAGKGVAPQNLSDGKIAGLVRSFEITNEKSSAVRYIATMNVRFKPRALQTLLGNAGLAFNPASSIPVVVLPISLAQGRAVLWEEDTAWRQALAGLEREAGSPPIIVPAGELNDVGAIDAGAAETGNPSAIAAIIRLHGAGSAVVAQLDADVTTADASQTQTITLARYDSVGSKVDEQTFTLQPSANVTAQLAQAVHPVLAFARHTNNASTTPAVGSTPSIGHSVMVTAPLDSLPALTRLKQKLMGVPLVRHIEVTRIARDGADLTLDLSGDATQLPPQLNAQGLTLLQTPTGVWQLTMAN